MDTTAFVEVTAGTIALLMGFFHVIAVLASVLCLFTLFTTFESNVRDNAWEFGVLRAVGASAASLGRVYLYESLSVISAAVALGTVVGALIAITLTLQQGLFTELPFRLVFPTGLLAFTVCTSMAAAAFGAALPVRDMLHRPIARVLKGA